MKVGAVLFALVISFAAAAAEPPPPASGAAPVTKKKSAGTEAGKKPSKDAAGTAQKGKATGQKAKGAEAKGTAEKRKTDPETEGAMRRAKARLVAAVGACARPDDCDPAARNADRDLVTLLKEADENFMEICRTCAAEDRCTVERDRMRAGKSSRGLDPCGK